MITFSTEINPFIILQIIVFVIQINLAIYIYTKYKEIKKFQLELRSIRYELDYYKSRYGLGKTDEEQDNEEKNMKNGK